MALLTSIFLYLASFIAIWLGAGLIIKSVDRLARKLKLSSFAISFFVLGLLTSIPETAVSFNAVAERKPEIFVGTLLGGVLVIFLFIIPVLAILNKGISIYSELGGKYLFLALLTMALPGFLVIDQRVTNFEGFLMIVAYITLFLVIERKHGIFDTNEERILEIKAYSFLDLIKVIFGIALVFISSNYIVDQTISFSEIFNIPTFYISLIVLSLGTNLPELSLAVRSIFSGKTEIVYGDYIGSAAANTLLFGFFTLLNDGEIITVNNFFITFLFIAAGLLAFYYFAKDQKRIGFKESLILITIYLLFVSYELGRGLIK